MGAAPVRSRQQDRSEERHGDWRGAARSSRPRAASWRPAWQEDLAGLQRLLGNRAFGAALRAAAEMPHLARVVPPSVVDALGDDARPLDPDLRAALTASGREPGDVRVHTGAGATASARAMDAEAYTVGTHIVLDESQGRPGTARRRQLLLHELAHVAQQRARGPAVQLATRTRSDPLRDALDPPLELDPEGLLPPPVQGQPGEARTIGSATERFDLERLREALHQAGYDEVYTRQEFAQSKGGWLERAFPDERSRPDLVAIRNQAGAKQVLVLDVTSGPGSVAEIRAGENRPLPVEIEERTSPGFQGNQYRPRDLVDEMEQSRRRAVPVQAEESTTRPHIAKTIEDARRLATSLPEDMQDSSVVAREYHWRTGEVTKLNIVKSRQERLGGTPPGTRGPATGAATARTGTATVAGGATTEQARLQEMPEPVQGTSPAVPEAPRVTASHETIEPFSRPPVVTATPVGGPAAEAAAQLLADVERALEIQAFVHKAQRAGSLRTYRWWLQRGITPPAKAVHDRWFTKDEVDTDPEAIARRIRSPEFDGMEVGRIKDQGQYEQFEAWVRANVHTWDDFYRHFVASEDAGVRWHDGRWEVVSWEWGDWWPANASRVVEQDERITRFMEQIRVAVIARTRQEVAATPGAEAAFARGSSAKIAGVRRFRQAWGVDKYLYTPALQIRLLINWAFDPVFYEISGVEVGDGYTLVAGADLKTYLEIHDYRAYYDRGSRPAGISAPARYDDEHPYTGWGPVNIPCILVRTESLTSATDASGVPGGGRR